MEQSLSAREARPAQYYEENDEIDLVELVGFLLRIKKFILGGLFLGLLLGCAVAFSIMRTTFNTKVSLSIDPASLPAISDPKKVSDAFQGALASPDLVSVAFRRLMESSPDLKNNLDKMGIALGDLISNQTQDPGAKSPLKVTAQLSGQDFLVETNLPTMGLGSDAGADLLASINELATEHNQRAILLHQESSKNLVRQASQAVEEAETNSSQVQSQHEGELLRIRSEVARMEYRLTRRAINSGSMRAYLDSMRLPSSLQFVSQNREGRLQVQASESELDIGRVMRLIAGLEEEKEIAKAEADEIKSKLVELQLNYLRNESLYSSVISANRAVLTALYDSMSKSVVPVDRTSTFLPLFRMNQQIYSDDLAKKSFEVRSNRRSAAIALASMAGLVGGALLGSLLEFLKKNKRKLELLSKNA